MDSQVHYVRHLKLCLVHNNKQWFHVNYYYHYLLLQWRVRRSKSSPLGTCSCNWPAYNRLGAQLTRFLPSGQHRVDGLGTRNARGRSVTLLESPRASDSSKEQALSPRVGFVYSQACLCQLYLLLWDHGIKSQINQWNVSCLFLWERIWILWENSIKTGWWKNCHQIK